MKGTKRRLAPKPLNYLVKTWKSYIISKDAFNNLEAQYVLPKYPLITLGKRNSSHPLFTSLFFSSYILFIL